jgi:hypothetical protein
MGVPDQTIWTYDISQGAVLWVIASRATCKTTTILRAGDIFVMNRITNRKRVPGLKFKR